MSTRSNIIVEHTDKTVKRVYCHFDGYLEGVGATLLEHYNTQELAEALVVPGDMSSLGEKCDKPKGHSYNTPVEGYTVYYGRDRGEDDVGGTVYPSIDAALAQEEGWEEYVYLWRFQMGWFVARAGAKTLAGFRPLRDLTEEELKAPIKVPFLGTVGIHGGPSKAG
jgi:hypothetical protein